MTERSTVLVDMDGVLADFDGHLLDITTDLAWPDGFTRLHQTQRYSTNHLPKADRSEARKRINTPGFFADLPPVHGAREGMEQLIDLANVWVVSKPLEANPTCRDDKARWLAEHIGDGWERRLILAPDKSMVRGDVLLDDAPKPEWLLRAEWVPVIYPWAFNGEHSLWGDIPSWRWGDDFEDLIWPENRKRRACCD